MATLVRTDQDKEKGKGDLFTSFQNNLPFNLINGENGFAAISPVTGYNYHNPVDGQSCL